MTAMMSNPVDYDLEIYDTVSTKTPCPRCGGRVWMVEDDGLDEGRRQLRCIGRDYQCFATRPIPKVRPKRREIPADHRPH